MRPHQDAAKAPVRNRKCWNTTNPALNPERINRRCRRTGADLEQIIARKRGGNFGGGVNQELYDAILDDLESRGIVKTSNKPVSDYTEWLIAL
jgi:hypothetical protein